MPAKTLPVNQRKNTGPNYIKKADLKNPLRATAKKSGFSFKCPRGVTAQYRKSWKKLEKHCVELEIAGQFTQEAVTNFIRTEIDLEAVRDQLDAEGRTVWHETQHGRNLKSHPLAAQENVLANRYWKLLDDFAMTARGLAKVAPLAPDKPEAKPEDEFFAPKAANAA